MSKEVLKMALEALESLKVTVSSRTEANVIDGVDLFHKQMAALQKALANEALGKMAENARELGLDYEPAQQEPVARLQVFMESFDMGQSLAPNTEYKFASASACQAAKMLPLGNYDLYTSPQAQPAQRTWVGLTDEERGQIINSNFGTGLWLMAKDIEAKLRSKNEDRN